MKGQVFSVDLIIALSIFSFVLLSYIIIWDNILNKIYVIEENKKMEESARAASSQLILSSGDPSDWELIEINGSSLHSIGLVSQRNVINEKKWERFISLNSTHYSLIKEVLGLPLYEMKLSIIRNESVIGVFGKSPEEESEVIVIERMGILNNSEVIIKLEVWSS